MAVKDKQKFTSDRMEKLHNYVLKYDEMGEPTDYEILVDGLKAVKRTNNPEMWDIYESFIDADTKSVEVIFYNGTSNNNDKYIFHFGKEESSDGLSGLEIDNRITAGVAAAKKEWEHERLVEENQQLKEEIEELEGEIDDLENKLAAIEQNKSPMQNVLGELGSSFVESFVRRNPQMLTKLPGGETLAGLLESPKAALSAPMEKDTEVSFTPHEDNPQDAPASGKADTDEEGRELAVFFVNKLKSFFSQEEFDQVVLILDGLAKDKTKINAVINFLTINTNNNNE